MKNFNDYSAFAALDIVLKVICEIDDTMWGMTMDEIQDKLRDTEDTQFAPQEIDILLNQMLIDGNIELNRSGRFKISLAGLFLHRKGGYFEQEAARVADEARLKSLSMQQAQQGKALVRLNLVLAIGTSIAAIYYLIEIAKWMYQN